MQPSLLRSALVHLGRNRLVHFVVLGALLWKLAPTRDAERDVVVEASAIADAVRAEQARVARPLTGDEKQRVMASLASEELLYREGLRLGIGGDDAIVRARIAERMRMHLASASATTVGADEVRVEAERAATRMPARVRLAVAFVSKDRLDAVPASDALSLALARSPDVAPPYGGDRAPIDAGKWWLQDDLARAAGPSVARAAMETAVGSWSSPIASTWGFYIVRPLERRSPTPEEAMEAAAESVRRRKQAEAVSRAVARIASDYAVTVRAPAGEPAFDPRSLSATSGRGEGVD